MEKRKKCKKCGGAYIFNIPSSFFEREQRLSLKCPYCESKTIMVIEDGTLLEEEKANPYLKKLPAINLVTRPWFQLK
ncbi:MAG: hypothetical protein ACTSW1_02660 [Candidatus Hodarchaeales archaeon]